MTDSNYTHILVIADRSGSMGYPPAEPPARAMTAALNELFAKQKELPGKCLVDYVQFDTRYEVVYADRPVTEASALIQPRWGTALNDAIARGTKELGAKLKALPEHARPANVIVAIVTDGQENSSVEYHGPAGLEGVKAIVSKQINDYNWEFLFLGANMDAVEVGGGYGIPAASSLTYDSFNPIATASAGASLSAYATKTRSGAKGAFTDAERLAAVGGDSEKNDD